MKKRDMVIRTVVFMLGICVFVGNLSKVLSYTDRRVYQIYEGFYHEEEGSLDAVYIGASNVYAYWQPEIAWKDHGYAISTISSPDMPTQAVKYMITEARKTQPDALIIVNLNGLKNAGFSREWLHSASDYMRLSANKISMVEALGKEIGLSWMDRLQYFFPFIQFHSVWSDLKSEAFTRELEGLKNSVHYGTFLKTASNVSFAYDEVTESMPLDEKRAAILEELLAYCREEDVNVLFVFVPQMEENRDIQAYYNTISEIVEAEGFPVLNLNRSFDEIGLSSKYDFYNDYHTNLHGSLKYTEYLSQYLGEHYGFEDKRGNPAYSSWDEAVVRYMEIIDEYALDFELEHLARDYALEAPTLKSVQLKEGLLTVAWKQVENADGYRVYRKNNSLSVEENQWGCIAQTDAEADSYADATALDYEEYLYTVVPVRYDGDETLYGNFNAAGAKSWGGE